ncbi:MULTISPECIES: zinc dependent phospholipase C family protein [Clostridium]|uniref:Phospholipase C n=1 Tax=Clostridium novyi (strain NT) TaxID=386415 RepID=A0PZB7_CLONN|nr:MULTISPECIES: zinc dependent phospholipase C family protein [Clostridium]ABK61937.1 phospholipase C related protein [Clostridium novyi NT]KEH87695.1 phospholipase [Clostridium novyi A str. NCTC 538]KEH88785.1 phospholipase [Clostridium novyi A str. 4540]KEH91537.1 phospholipase [Clostridium novyi A str. GD211209]KEH91730.1 phospholipase [Clostridium botulinum C/D str. It1]
MKTILERAFGKTARGVMVAVNPIKKAVIKTHCITHKYINNKSLELLKTQGYIHEYRYFKNYINDINAGVTWADQDLKSINHFYHVDERKGIYGFSNALEECKKYYKLSLRYLKIGDVHKSMFFFGAACHLIQDTTVPHHVNNRLLKKHRDFELWIIKQILLGYNFETDKDIKRYRSVEEYIQTNALMANTVYFRYNYMKNKEEKYMKVAPIIIEEAQITTAGFMLDYYDKIKNTISLFE